MMGLTKEGLFVFAAGVGVGIGTTCIGIIIALEALHWRGLW